MSEPQCAACGAPMRPRNEWVYRCDRCGFFSSTLTPGGGTGVDGLEDLRRSNDRVILDRLERLHPLRGLRVLEVGSAWGWFLTAAQARGAITHGIEPEEANARRCIAAGLSVEHGLFPQDLLDRGPFDVIAFNDVFEHLPDPAAAIQEVERLLKPGGVVVLNLPSSHGVLFRLASLLERLGYGGVYDRLWQRGLASPHVSYFTPGNLLQLVTAHTALRLADRFPLQSVSRRGLFARIASSHRNLVGIGLLAGTWLLSFVLPWLPSDIEVLVFQRDDPPSTI